ncbi:hypothetical protein [Blastopirellula marina]|uniref:Uncharacterized protein n=1 Tax=Blastopirellula marina TaxID=124 RepID=A0A2S8GH91_9BACT|nr:hypothetical protein [Blastopirellula marina]PQO43828.1 hypothetical protein C5Y93_21825 [Blastopirellula marina]
MELVIESGGKIRCIYDEAIDLGSLGNLRIERASHVEPTAEGLWTVDLTPVAGPKFGMFAGRNEALAAEIAWLSQNWLMRND